MELYSGKRSIRWRLPADRDQIPVSSHSTRFCSSPLKCGTRRFSVGSTTFRRRITNIFNLVRIIPVTRRYCP